MRYFFFMAAMLAAIALPAQNIVETLAKQRVKLPNGWSLTPAGRQLEAGDLPLNVAVSSNGRHAALVHAGVGRHFIQLVDVAAEKTLDEQTIAKAWYGLSFSADGKRLYASGGNDNLIAIYAVENDKLRRDTAIRLGQPLPAQKIWPTGLAVQDKRQRLFVTTLEDSSVYVCNTATLKVDQKIKLESAAYACALSPKQDVLYVSLWGAGKIAVFDAEKMTRTGEIKVGMHPNEMLLTKNGRYLLVANALDNSVSVIDTRTNKEVEVLNAALYPDAPNGSTTNSLALSADEKTLYVANADNNCLAVFNFKDPGESFSKGFIPTGWYPTSVRVAGNKILVANGKGTNSAPNPRGPQPTMVDREERRAQYIGGLFFGKMSFVDAPTDAMLAGYSKLTYDNTPYTKQKEREAEGQAGNPIPMRVGAPSPIKYVFYIVKENRTYDQVLGDLPQGNGDPSLCLFPERVTPNQHALVREFVLLDNFYVDAEVSADGHNWSMGAYANDYVEKKWPTGYGGRGGQYDYEGSSPMAHPKGGYIWDNCKRNNVTYRTYGEFADNYKANYATIEGHYCPNYSSWGMDILDLDREKTWEHDFDSLLAAGAVRQFNTVRFGNDHTSGMQKGAYSPEASVADNDLAVGRFIEHLSKSSIWAQSAVFILEDDAQNGPDHVDAHRSTAYVISPYVKRGFVDHTMYSTSSMLRTMELILGMPPMSQYDAAATPMWRCFTDQPNLKPFTVVPNQVPLDTRNAAVNELSRISETFNLAQLDAVPEREFNEVLWKAIKGLDSEMPAPRRAAFIQPAETDEEEAAEKKRGKKRRK